MKILKIAGFILLVILLTFTTQIGGIVLLGCIPLFRFIHKKFDQPLKRRIVKPLSFIGVYLIATFCIVPFIAAPLGRETLPVFGNDELKPLNIMTCILNRHYVKSELLETIEAVASDMNSAYPGSEVSYLDASFPFIDGCPLLPHLSHDDGEKLDLAFFYKDHVSQEALNNSAPSFIGYGVYEGPKSGEYDKPLECEKAGYWQYSALQLVVPQWNKEAIVFDEERTKKLVQLLVAESATSKLFIEPHLKTRMGLSNSKIRFHGCGAVRHDDHIHVQL